jgi:hypothetical protein
MCTEFLNLFLNEFRKTLAFSVNQVYNRVGQVVFNGIFGCKSVVKWDNVENFVESVESF